MDSSSEHETQDLPSPQDDAHTDANDDALNEENENENENEIENENSEEENNNGHDTHNENTASKDSSSPGKIFIGGLSRDTTTAAFTKYFSKYGEITDSVIMRDRNTGQPRGFGFVTYADPSVVDKVIRDKHTLDGRTVEIKRTIPRGSAPSKGPKTKKIFVGGIPTSITDDEFKEYFAKFGKVVEHQIMQDRATGRSRGFGFITFDSEQVVEDIIAQGRMLELGGKQVEIKKAEPKKSSSEAGPGYGINNNRPPHFPGAVGSFRDGYSGFGGPGYGSNAYRSGAAYGVYGGPEYGRGYAGYGASGLASYEDNPRGYAGRGTYSDGYGNYGNGMMGSYGTSTDGYGTYPDSGYSGGYDSRVGGPYGSVGSYGAGRGAYGGGGSSGRYHPYAR